MICWILCPHFQEIHKLIEKMLITKISFTLIQSVHFPDYHFNESVQFWKAENTDEKHYPFRKIDKKEFSSLRLITSSRIDTNGGETYLAQHHVSVHYSRKAADSQNLPSISAHLQLINTFRFVAHARGSHECLLNCETNKLLIWISILFC